MHTQVTNPTRISAKRRLLSTGSLLLMASAISGIGANEALAADAANPAADTQPPTTEIVVNAQKYKQSQKDVPITITALSSNSLVKGNVQTTADLPQLVSGLVWATEGAWALPALRGVSTNLAAVGASPPVAIYLDGVYQPDTSASIMDLPDIDHIEVLKGPQGTLFGRNATGGAISIYTLDPAFTTTGKISLSGGMIGGDSAKTSGDYTASGYVSGPLVGDTLAASVSGYYNRIDGYMTNDVTGARGGEITAENVRGKLLWKPTDSIKVVATGYYSHRDDGTAMAGFPYDGITVASQYPGAIVPTQPWHYAYNGLAPDVRTSVASGSLKADFDLGFGTLTNTAAYTSYSSDINGTGHAAYGSNACVTAFACVVATIGVPQKSWSEELDFASKRLGDVRFVGGLFVFSNIAREQDAYNYGAYLDNTRMDIKSYAAFGEGTWYATEKLSFIAGVRVTKDKLNAAGSYFGGPLQEYANGSWLSATPRFSATYKFNPVVNGYFTFSEGFKGGVASGQYTPGVAPANPEKLYSYEVGLKAGSNGYRANIAAFYYDYSDLQVETLTNGGVTTVPENAAKARIYGIDFDASAVVVPGLQLKLNATWLPEAKYTAFPNAIVYVAPMTPNGEATNYNYDASGSRMLNAPRISGTLSADYTTTTQAGGWDLNASIYHSSSYRWVYTGTVQTGQYSLVGARLTFTPASTGLKLSIYGKNLTNAAYFDGMTPNPDASVGFYGQPREVGISGEYSF